MISGRTLTHQWGKGSTTRDPIDRDTHYSLGLVDVFSRGGCPCLGDQVKFGTLLCPATYRRKKAARRLHLTLTQFDLIRDNLFARGFPQPDPDTGMYDLVAIENWMDVRHTPTSLTSSKIPRNAHEVFSDRARRLRDG